MLSKQRRSASASSSSSTRRASPTTLLPPSRSWLENAASAAAQGGSSPSPSSANPQRLPARRPRRGPDDDDDEDDDEDAVDKSKSKSNDDEPSFVWDPRDVVGAYGALFAILACGTSPWLAEQRYGYVPYFLSLAFASIYLGAHRGLAREDRETFSLNQSAAAPFALSASLLGVYLILKYTDFDLGTLVSAYFWLLGTVAVGSNLVSPIAAVVGDDVASVVAFVAPVPEGVAVDAATGEPVVELPVSVAAAVACALGVAAATADVVCGHSNHTLNNFLACCIAADFLSLLGVGSFAAAGALLTGLLAYDAFWVFGSGAIFGDGGADSSVMMTVATSESFRGPFRLLFPRFDDALNPPPMDVFPFSLLGLGDIAVPGLLACIALRYDASRATDMRGRATAAAAAFMGAFDDAWEEADEEAAAAAAARGDGDASLERGARADALDESVAERAAAAAERAFDDAAEALGDTAGSRRGDGDGDGDGGAGNGTPGTTKNMVVPRSMGGRAMFSSVMRGYVAGLLIAIGVNACTGTGQPALVYLVPCALGSLGYTASRRGEVERLMAFKDERSSFSEKL
jgi:minor histocompatibility antigen H13